MEEKKKTKKKVQKKVKKHVLEVECKSELEVYNLHNALTKNGYKSTIKKLV